MSDLPAGSSFTRNGERLAGRRRILRLTVGAGCACTLAAAYPFLASMAPSARALAEGGPVEADIKDVEDGELKTLAWRGQPVWILRRTPAMLDSLAHDDGLLKDPHSRVPQQPADCRNDTRSIKPEWFVCIGICTHLGCSPGLRPKGSAEAAQLGANWPGGFLCPCHGSKFDLAGRVFKDVPAPTNLVIPPHHYLSESRILIGEG